MDFEQTTQSFLSVKESELLIKKGSSSKLTIQNYNSHYRSLIRFLKAASGQESAIELELITAVDIEDYLKSLLDTGKSQATLSARLYAYRSFWKWANVQYGIPNVAKQIERKAQVYEEAAHMTQKHLMKFMDHLWGLPEDKPLVFRSKVFFMVVIKLGLRVSEALALEKKSINFAEGEMVFRITGKGGKKRVLPLPLMEVNPDGSETPLPNMVAFHDLLRRYLKEPTGLPWFRRKAKDKPLSWLFQGARGTKLSYQQVRLAFHEIMAECRLKNVGYTIHSLRHTAATNWLSSEVDMKTVSELLGHSNLMTTLTIYSHTEKSKLRKGLAKGI